MTTTYYYDDFLFHLPPNHPLEEGEETQIGTVCAHSTRIWRASARIIDALGAQKTTALAWALATSEVRRRPSPATAPRSRLACTDCAKW